LTLKGNPRSCPEHRAERAVFGKLKNFVRAGFAIIRRRRELAAGFRSANKI
jgi:hypothetical protein